MFGERSQIFKELKRKFHEKIKIAEDELDQEIEKMEEKLQGEIQALYDQHDSSKSTTTDEIVKKHFGNLI